MNDVFHPSKEEKKKRGKKRKKGGEKEEKERKKRKDLLLNEKHRTELANYDLIKFEVNRILRNLLISKATFPGRRRRVVAVEKQSSLKYTFVHSRRIRQ